jgi:hypothetical protein
MTSWVMHAIVLAALLVGCSRPAGPQPSIGGDAGLASAADRLAPATGQIEGSFSLRICPGNVDCAAAGERRRLMLVLLPRAIDDSRLSEDDRDNLRSGLRPYPEIKPNGCAVHAPGDRQIAHFVHWQRSPDGTIRVLLGQSADAVARLRLTVLAEGVRGYTEGGGPSLNGPRADPRRRVYGERVGAPDAEFCIREAHEHPEFP